MERTYKLLVVNRVIWQPMVRYETNTERCSTPNV